jgi:hypothetical protein
LVVPRAGGWVDYLVVPMAPARAVLMAGSMVGQKAALKAEMMAAV